MYRIKDLIKSTKSYRVVDRTTVIIGSIGDRKIDPPKYTLQPPYPSGHSRTLTPYFDEKKLEFNNRLNRPFHKSSEITPCRSSVWPISWIGDTTDAKTPFAGTSVDCCCLTAHIKNSRCLLTLCRRCVLCSVSNPTKLFSWPPLDSQHPRQEEGSYVVIRASASTTHPMPRRQPLLRN